VSNVIVSKCIKYSLDMDKLLDQGYNGCSVMASIQNGVQARIREKYPKAAFVHCASHRLKLVVNDLTDVSDIRNVVGVIKKIINFFRDSSKRRALVPNLPPLCETQWTEKYKSICTFSHNFEKIFDCLVDLEITAAGETRQTAHVLLSACSSCTFLICLFIVANSSSVLEPVELAEPDPKFFFSRVDSGYSESNENFFFQLRANFGTWFFLFTCFTFCVPFVSSTYVIAEI
jgi:hypothetical protein